MYGTSMAMYMYLTYIPYQESFYILKLFHVPIKFMIIKSSCLLWTLNNLHLSLTPWFFSPCIGVGGWLPLFQPWCLPFGHLEFPFWHWTGGDNRLIWLAGSGGALSGNWPLFPRDRGTGGGSWHRGLKGWNWYRALLGLDYLWSCKICSKLCIQILSL